MELRKPHLSVAWCCACSSSSVLSSILDDDGCLSLPFPSSCIWTSIFLDTVSFTPHYTYCFGCFKNAFSLVSGWLSVRSKVARQSSFTPSKSPYFFSNRPSEQGINNQLRCARFLGIKGWFKSNRKMTKMQRQKWQKCKAFCCCIEQKIPKYN